jgi:Cbb3-type cytochrome oxidase component FixQ.
MEFDIHTLRGVMSAVILLVFVVLFVWVSLGGRDRFRDAAALPFADDEQDGSEGHRSTNGKGEQQA